MALTDLLTALEADADTETERLRAETDAEARRIVASARSEARAYELQAGKTAEEELAYELERRRSEARLAAASLLRDAYDSCVATLESALRDRLGELRDTDAYPGVLRRLIEEGLAAVPAAGALRVDPRDLRLAQGIVDELGARLELRPELDTLGGVEVAGDDGRTARNTLEERLRNAEPELRLLVSELLHPATAATMAHAGAEEALT
jgi:V/A-type H+-transporting ATPase subunit E